VARVNKTQLLDFIQLSYGSEPHEEVDKLIDFVHTLEDAGEYALVAEEY
jgi:spore cortex formation protein SpoVR/YcgB (stage V sporulation)